METRPIPAFYCCYLLRSTTRHSALYIGSTPHPQRRLTQHNGRGGAVRTARNNLRPWEMACIVTGFPSKIAALQFEWAWYNTHITKRIADHERITPRKTIERVSKKTGKIRKFIKRPRPSMRDKISNLHLLLRVPSFARWPLQPRFFCEDVYRVWERWTEKVSGTVGPGNNVILGRRQPVAALADNAKSMSPRAKDKRKREAPGKGGVESVDVKSISVDYSALKGHLEKSALLMAENEDTACAVCGRNIDDRAEMRVVCPHDACKAASHVTCLATRFLAEEGPATFLIPTSGKCPACKAETQWVDLVREMSLRARGEKHVALMMQKTRERKTKAATKTKVAEAQIEVEGSKDEDGAKLSDDDSDDELLQIASVVDDPLPDDWHYQEDDDDMASVTSVASDLEDGFSAVSHSSPQARAPRLEAIIEDTDWDDDEVLA